MKRYYLLFLLRNMPDLSFEILKKDSDRLEGMLLNEESINESHKFFWFETVDGRSIAINLSDVQAVRYVWEPAAQDKFIVDLEKELEFEDGDDAIRICLRGRADPLIVGSEDPDQIFDFFKNLEYGPSIVAFPSFYDEDGELVHVSAREVVWASAPSDLLEEGRKIIAETDGLPYP